MENSFEPIRQFALNIGLVILLPAAVYWGVEVLSPTPRFVYTPMYGDLSKEKKSTTNEAEYTAEREAKNRLHEEQSKEHARTFIMVAAPVGLACIAAGTFFGMVAVGWGLILGGSVTLATGYFMCWDQITPLLRFLSLLAGILLIMFCSYFLQRRARQQR